MYNFDNLLPLRLHWVSIWHEFQSSQKHLILLIQDYILNILKRHFTEVHKFYNSSQYESLLISISWILNCLKWQLTKQTIGCIWYITLKFLRPCIEHNSIEYYHSLCKVYLQCRSIKCNLKSIDCINMCWKFSQYNLCNPQLLHLFVRDIWTLNLSLS